MAQKRFYKTPALIAFFLTFSVFAYANHPIQNKKASVFVRTITLSIKGKKGCITAKSYTTAFKIIAKIPIPYIKPTSKAHTICVGDYHHFTLITYSSKTPPWLCLKINNKNYVAGVASNNKPEVKLNKNNHFTLKDLPPAQVLAFCPNFK